MPFTNRFILNNKQKKLNILEWPSQINTQKTCLLLHGFSNNAYVWDTIAQKLSEKYHVYALDFRGHGDSDWDTEGEYKHQDFALDLNYALVNLNLHKPHIIGHSLGARVATLFLQENDFPISSFTLIDTGPQVNEQASKKIRQDVLNSPTLFNSPQDYLNYISKIYWLADKNELESMAKYDLKKIAEQQWQLKLDPEVVKNLWATSKEENIVLQQVLWQALEKITVPSLILRGQISAVLRKEVAEKMQAKMQHSKYFEIKKSGHAVMMDNPEETTQSIWNFLQEIDAAA